MAVATYQTGTVALVNGDETVELTGGVFTGNVNDGGIFVGPDNVPYAVGSVTDDTHLELAAPFAGVSGSGLSYQITNDYTPKGFPLVREGDARPWGIFSEAMRRIDAYFETFESGVDGAGGVTLDYVFSATTADADPGAGTLRLNHGTQASATSIFADLTDAGGVTVTAILDMLDDSSSANKGQLRLMSRTDQSRWAIFNITAVVTATGYRKLTVANVAVSGVNPFADGDSLVLQFVRTGDKGDTGTVGADLTSIEALTGTGILARTGADAWALRTLTGTVNQITVTNGNGVSGNPVLSLPADFIVPSILTAALMRSAAYAAIADDGVMVITPPATMVAGLLFVIGASNSQPLGIFGFRNTPTANFCVLIAGTTTPSIPEVNSIALTGTTGTDGKMTVAAANDGKIYIENRLGAVRNYGYVLFGS